MSDVVIQVDHLWKKYRLGILGTGTLRHDFNRWLHRALGKPDPYAKVGSERGNLKAAEDSGQKPKDRGQRSEAQSTSPRVSASIPQPSPEPPSLPSSQYLSLRDDEMWALRDISFEVKRGEILGIIGGNGAGKSTLLKILSRVTAPTSGEVRVKGRIASLLEVGTGFHPELTGRENIFLNGAILGMTKLEIRAKLDEIAAFSEIEKYIDTPVKRYSSGMYVRLAFAVAAHLDPEILILDEVLAVGDTKFQQKCLGKIQSVSQSGRTVLFVSHNMAAVQSLCTAAVVLRNGQLTRMGDVRTCTEAYLVVNDNRKCDTWVRRLEPVKASLYFTRARAHLTGAQPRLGLEVDLELTSHGKHASGFIAIDILNSMGTVIMQALPRLQPFITHQSPTHLYRVSLEIPPLIPGCYWLTLWTGSHNNNTYDQVNNALCIEVLESPTKGRTFPHGQDHGAIVPTSSIVELRADE